MGKLGDVLGSRCLSQILAAKYVSSEGLQGQAVAGAPGPMPQSPEVWLEQNGPGSFAFWQHLGVRAKLPDSITDGYHRQGCSGGSFRRNSFLQVCCPSLIWYFATERLPTSISQEVQPLSQVKRGPRAAFSGFKALHVCGRSARLARLARPTGDAAKRCGSSSWTAASGRGLGGAGVPL